MPVDSRNFNDGPVHAWFGLSYAHYLTVPRSIMQAMPKEWQERMVELMNELGDSYDWHPESFIYYVMAAFLDEDGHVKHDGDEEFQGETITAEIQYHDRLSEYRRADLDFIESLETNLKPVIQSNYTSWDLIEKELVLLRRLACTNTGLLDDIDEADVTPSQECVGKVLDEYDDFLHHHGRQDLGIIAPGNCYLHGVWDTNTHGNECPGHRERREQQGL